MCGVGLLFLLSFVSETLSCQAEVLVRSWEHEVLIPPTAMWNWYGHRGNASFLWSTASYRYSKHEPHDKKETFEGFVVLFGSIVECFHGGTAVWLVEHGPWSGHPGQTNSKPDTRTHTQSKYYVQCRNRTQCNIISISSHVCVHACW